MTSKYEMAARARKRKRKISNPRSSKPSFERTKKMNERLAKQAKNKKIKSEKSLTPAQKRKLALAARSGAKASVLAGSPVRQMQRQQALKATRPQMKKLGKVGAKSKKRKSKNRSSK